MKSAEEIKTFIAKWEKSGGAERASYQTFLGELCEIMEVPKAQPPLADPRENSYVHDHPVPSARTDKKSKNFIDLYKRGCFVLETKQGVSQRVPDDPFLKAPKLIRRGHGVRGTGGWLKAMSKAKEQADGYVRSLPPEEGRPPFLVVVDVGYCIELYSEFSCSGGIYRHFPDSNSYRILLTDLLNEDIRDRLRRVWLDPLSLDPSRYSTEVSRDVAIRLADLAKSLEIFSGNSPKLVGEFLMRCLFTFFAEDVGLLPDGRFTAMLEDLRGKPELAPDMIEDVWEAMRDGVTSPALKEKLLRFNGGLFEHAKALTLTEEQLARLIEAGKADWRHVEPAIFGTLLERALAPTERHKLGAHYTPREYVERLVIPTVIQPLTEEWEAVKAKALAHHDRGQDNTATKTIERFLHRLCTVRILDPACGSGNFLYITFEHLKRLEGEVLTFWGDINPQTTIHSFSTHGSTTVDPHQLLGIEVNPRAAAIAEMVLWIGHLQWHFRTHGNARPEEPVLKKFHNIECRDAVLVWDSVEPVVDAHGQPVTRWDGRTTKIHPVTGEEVPDEAAQVSVLRYKNPRPATWPTADFVVGNPPFIGAASMRQSLGDGYAEALRCAWPEVPESADLVMYWWHHAAELTRAGKLQRFGFITTNSLRQTFNRRVLGKELTAEPPLSLIFAIPDHPWVDASDGAAVRIAMTVGVAGKSEGRLLTVLMEKEANGEGLEVALDEQQGSIHADLRIGANVAGAVALRANGGVSSPGYKLHGAGFIVTPEDRAKLEADAPIRPYRNGRDLTDKPRNVMVIDLFGHTQEDVRQCWPATYQWVLERVKPERDHNNRASYRDKWWIFGEPRKDMRPALTNLPRYIVTVETAKHRFFQFHDATIAPDNMLVVIASSDAHVLGVLSSRMHVVWALAAGGRLGVGNDPRYNKSRCFETFPFPASTGDQKGKIRTLAEQLDALRKKQQKQHPGLTLTGIYNVLHKVRAGTALTAKDKTIHEQGLVSVLKQLHDDLDSAVMMAYGWPADLADEEILEHLVTLNAERAQEESQGLVRWLRPEFQHPPSVPEADQAEEKERTERSSPPKAKIPFPKGHTAQLQAVREVLVNIKHTASTEEVARSFLRARTATVATVLDDLEMLGLIKRTPGGGYLG